MAGLCRPRIFGSMISKASMILAFSIDAKASNKDLLFFTPPFSIASSKSHSQSHAPPLPSPIMPPLDGDENLDIGGHVEVDSSL